MRRRRQAIASLAVVGLLVGACTRAEGETEIGAAVSSGDRAQTVDGGDGDGGTSGSRLDEGSFGDLENLCADGEPGTVTETGLTADEIHLGTVTDRGSAERPGLTQEMYDSAVAFAAWCNEHGGIGGRQIVIDDLDAKLFEYGQRVGEACQRDFALVGGGAVFDAQDNGARVACGLPNLPGYAVTPQARVAEMQVQPVPNPVYSFASAGYRWLQGEFPEADKLGILWVNLDGPATIHDQIVEMAESMGYEVVFDEQYRPLGETGLAEGIDNQAVRPWAAFRGFEHDGVAAGKRHGNRAHSENDRRIPRRDTEDHADRLAHGERDAPGLVGWNHLARNLRR